MTLAEMLATMDIPQQRKNDMRWLLRNLAIRNSHNKHFAAAMKLIITATRHNSHYTAGYYNFPYVGKTAEDKTAYEIGRDEAKSNILRGV